MKQDEHYYVIGIGGAEGCQAGRGSIYYVKDRNRECAIPVFTTPEGAESYTRTNFDEPEAYLSFGERRRKPCGVAYRGTARHDAVGTRKDGDGGCRLPDS